MSKRAPWSRLILATALGVSLLAGCNGTPSPSTSASPSSPASPGAAQTPPAVVKATPGKVETEEVKAGEGVSIDESGAGQAEVEVWLDKFNGTPMGKGGKMPVLLVPGSTPLPGLVNATKGMKKDGVRRVTIAAQDLFGTIPPGAPFDPEQAFFLEVTLKDLYPKEPFEVKTVKEGSGKGAVLDDVIRVKYTGRTEGFDSKKIFDSSEGKAPLTVKLGGGQVITGWEKGLEGIKRGEKRRLSIPHYMAYGDQARGEMIPAKSRLFFDIEMVDFVTPGTLKTKVEKPGKGEALKSGQTGDFHYTGWLDGFKGKEKFDSSKDRGTPFTVEVGAGRVIPGWDEGLQGMKPGEVRLLEIPYNLAYGERGQQSIPPFATLYFEVEYLGLAKPKPTPAPAAPGGAATPAEK